MKSLSYPHPPFCYDISMVHEEEDFEQINNSAISSISSIIQIPKAVPSKFNYEFQELCSQLEPIYGKLIWTLPHKVGFTEYKIRKAHDIATLKGITKIGYLIGIIKKLP